MTTLRGWKVEASKLSKQRGAVLVAKRLVDIVGAVLLLAVTAPLLLITAVAVKLDTAGPVLFRATRIGQGGRPFTMFKFRSMAANADQSLHVKFIKNLLQNGDAQSRSENWYKLENDPRITRVGRVIRRWSIDELPQLFNVVKGDMSLVGPRPEVPYAVEEYEAWQWQRFDVLPGMTGLWQISGRGELSPIEMLRLDVAYVNGYSLWLDLKLLAKTLGAVAMRIGSR